MDGENQDTEELHAAGANVYQATNDENAELRQRYISYLRHRHLLHHPIGQLPPNYKRYIALNLRTKSLFESDWKEYVFLMGVQDDMQIAAIQASAECQKDMPMFVALNQYLKDTSFAHLIYALLQLEHYSILRHLETYTTRLIEGSHKTTAKGCIRIGPKYGSEQSTSTAYSTVFDGNFKQNLISERETVPSAPAVEENIQEEKITVFIQHTKSDTDYAVQLSTKLKSSGFKVQTMSDMDAILAINDTEALNAIHQEVDFIVPVVSESLLKQIHAANDRQQLDSEDAGINKYFYKLIMQEYKKNNCHNFKVRPVIVPGMTKQKLRQDIVLSSPYRLGEEDDILIRILKVTKDLIPHYRKRNK